MESKSGRFGGTWAVFDIAADFMMWVSAPFKVWFVKEFRLMKEAEEAKKLKADAKILDRLGCFGVVLEKIPAKLAKSVTKSISVPTIGIGGGPDTDGQVLVTHDLLGITKEFQPRFLRRYMAVSYTHLTLPTTPYV